MSPGQVDSGSVRRHLLTLDSVLKSLSSFSGKSVKLLTEDTKELWAVERGLQLCTQCVLDIATHIVASAGRDVADYTSALDEIGKIGVIPSDLAMRLRPLAGFRNALVYGYLDIDIERLHDVLNHHLDEVREFAQHINWYLAQLA